MTSTPFFDQSTHPEPGKVRSTTERLDGTVALVTGASSGIGAATAAMLAANGATVALRGAAKGPPRRPRRCHPRPGWYHVGAGVGHNQRATGDRRSRAHGRRVRPSRHPRQQRRRDAARPGGWRALVGVAGDGGAQRVWAALLRACGATAPAPRGSRTARAGSPTW